MDFVRQDTVAEKKLFDQIAALGGRKPIPQQIYQDIYFQLTLLKEDRTAVRPGGAMLELGCNDGLHCFNLSQAGYRATGIDISSKAIQYAKVQAEKDANGVRFLIADASNLNDFEAGSFDVVFMFGFLHHFYYSKGILTVLRQADRLLRPKGVAVIAEPNHHYLYNRLCFTAAHYLLKIHEFNFLKNIFSINERSLVPEHLQKLVRENFQWQLKKMCYFDYVNKIIEHQGYGNLTLFYFVKRFLDKVGACFDRERQKDFFGLVFEKGG